MKTALRLLAIPAIASVALGIASAPALASPKAYALDYATGSVSVIDTQTNQIVGAPIPVGNGPYSIAITPDGRTAYVANESGESISVVDLQSAQAVGAPSKLAPDRM